jgi:hypothetical protein
MKPSKGLRRTGFTNRGKPLRRYTGLSRTPFRQPAGQSGKEGPVASSRTRAERAPSLRGGGRLRATRSRFLVDAKAVIEERSGRNCEIQLDGCKGQATEKSHRITQKSGGRHGAAKERSDRPSNAMDSCWWCHLVITERPWLVDAKGNGWVLEEWQEPTAVPVLYRGDLVYLDDAGNKISFEKAGA